MRDESTAVADQVDEVAPDLPGQSVLDDGLARDAGDGLARDVVVEDVLVEEVSIDGMCGVY